MAMSFATYAEIERMLWKNECLIEIEQEALGTMVGNLRETQTKKQIQGFSHVLGESERQMKPQCRIKSSGDDKRHKKTKSIQNNTTNLLDVKISSFKKHIQKSNQLKFIINNGFQFNRQNLEAGASQIDGQNLLLLAQHVKRHKAEQLEKETQDLPSMLPNNQLFIEQLTSRKCEATCQTLNPDVLLRKQRQTTNHHKNIAQVYNNGSAQSKVPTLSPKHFHGEPFE